MKRIYQRPPRQRHRPIGRRFGGALRCYNFSELIASRDLPDCREHLREQAAALASPLPR